jgi:hypothetical protein
MFRRYKQSDYWHWHIGCPFWPTEEYQNCSTQPLGGRLCPDCERLSGEQVPRTDADFDVASGEFPLPRVNGERKV